MDLEIEKRFLLKRHNPDRPHDELIKIDQFYFKNKQTGIWERIRKARYKKEDTTRYFHTIKTPVSPGVKEETERIITKKEFQKYLSKCTKALVKDRFIYKVSDGLCWELDVFKGINVIIAEIELPDIDFKYEKLDFIEDEIIMDVTDTKKFSSRNLSLDFKLELD